LVEHVGSKAMAQRMGGESLVCISGLYHELTDGMLKGTVVHGFAFSLPFEEVHTWAIGFVINSKGFYEVLRKQGKAVTISLACYDFELEILAIYIAEFEHLQFTQSYT
ncbi:MAG: hypothetical protein EAY72_00015, partial [Bacteroidetes bacterium]